MYTLDLNLKEDHEIFDLVSELEAAEGAPRISAQLPFVQY